ncbi:MAG: 16S rRNA (cytosine(1402)-N(4))-methyltransferase RsmH [Sphingobacteriia bacterium]|nr:16S rRNA (cytosine(1402)-N(4))-methyltransferase RsmH [Sphingobacteriia bacterium]
MSSNAPHKPVMLNEVIEYLAPKPGKTIIDCTFGAGGYSRAILETGANVLAIDQDPNVEKFAKELQQKSKNFNFVLGNFTELSYICKNENITNVSGIVMDLGISSMQIDNPERGFSFMNDGPLDMRMSCKGTSAEEIVNSWDEKDLANLIYNYGDERRSRQVASAIIRTRKLERINTTSKLANIVRSVVKRSHKNPIDPATRTFQALRIAVNDELNSLKEALEQAAEVISENGRIVIVSFHSLEDKIVKTYFRDISGYGRPEMKTNFKILTRKPLIPSDEEIKSNVRSRSAKLRVIEKIGVEE